MALAAAQIAADWQAIVAWFRDHAPPCYTSSTRGSGASEADLATLEAGLGAALPADFRAYLQLANVYYGMCHFEYAGYDTTHILYRWQGLKELYDAGTFKPFAPHYPSDGRMIEVWWHPGWVPFAEDGGGNLLCLDLAPTARGTRGQVFGWEIHSGPLPPSAPSFAAYLATYRAQLLSNRYTYAPATGTFEGD